MTSVLLLTAAYLTSFCGFACLALAMPRHWTEASGQRARVVRHRWWRRPFGFGMLAVSYVLCIYRDGASFGSVLWVVLISLAAIMVALTLAWRPQWLLPPVWHRRPRGGEGA